MTEKQPQQVRKRVTSIWEGCRGNNVFCGGPGFTTDLKLAWDWLNSSSNPGPERLCFQANPHEELL